MDIDDETARLAWCLLTEEMVDGDGDDGCFVQHRRDVATLEARAAELKELRQKRDRYMSAAKVVFREDDIPDWRHMLEDVMRSIESMTVMVERHMESVFSARMAAASTAGLCRSTWL